MKSRPNANVPEGPNGLRTEASTNAVDEVTQLLREYADRGVFQTLQVEPQSRGAVAYRFRWLQRHQFLLRVDPELRMVCAQDLLPNIPYRSSMDQELRAFVKSRTGEDLPEHRRISPATGQLKCTNRKGSISLQLIVPEGSHLSLAVRKMVNLINEVFHGFLSGPYHDYMVKEFGVAEE